MGVGRLIGAGVAGLIFLVGGCSSFRTVDAGEIGLVNHYGAVSGETLQPGLHLVNPITTSVETMNTTSQRKDGETSVYTQDIQTANVKYAVTYSLDPTQAVRMRKTVGHEWEARLIQPAIESSIKTSFGAVNAINSIEKRPELQDRVEMLLRKTLGARGIRIENVQLTNIQFQGDFENAVESAQVATQNAVAAKNQTVTIQERANQQVITAKAEAEALRIKSEALASNPGLTQYTLAQKWDGHLPQQMIPGSTVPFINVQH
jgi:prohibitin 2